MNKPRILFVDDEPNVLDGIRRILRRKQREWELTFATNGADALSLMHDSPFDIVVSDMRMPEMDGAELLSRVMAEHPETIRIILSGYSDNNAVQRSLSCTHQYMSKPCEAGALTEQLTRALSLKRQLDNELVKRMIAQVDSLPSLPESYHEIQRISASEDEGIQEAGDVIARDIGMTAKLLQIVNSAFFGLAREVSDVRQAVALVGMETLKSLVLSANLFGELSAAQPIPGFSMKDFADHCNECGALAKSIVLTETDDQTMAEHAMTAGLLHDVGKLVMAARLPELFEDTIRTAQEDETTMFQVEMECEGFSHAAVGAYLLGLWRLPLPVLDAVAFHHDPQANGTESFNETVAVHIANVLSQRNNPGKSGNSAIPELDHDLISGLNLKGQYFDYQPGDLAAVCAE